MASLPLVQIFDSNGDELKQLEQWDSDRVLEFRGIDPFTLADIDVIHVGVVGHLNSPEAVPQVREDENSIKITLPGWKFTRYGQPLIFYGYEQMGAGELRTVFAVTMPLARRLKPISYSDAEWERQQAELAREEMAAEMATATDAANTAAQAATDAADAANTAADAANTAADAANTAADAANTAADAANTAADAANTAAERAEDAAEVIATAKAKVDRMYGKKDNLFDKADPDIVIGRYISGITSDQPKWTSNSSRGETGYIPVNAGERIAYLPTRESVATANYYALFDADKQVVRVSSTYNSNKYVSIPEGAAYIRFSMLLANIDTIMIFKLDDSDPLPVDPANYTYNVYGGYSLYETVPRVDAIESAIMPLVPRITRALGKDNLFDKTDEDIVNGRYISSVRGGEPSWTPNAAYAETGYIPVSPGDRLAIMPTADTVSTALYYARFNSQKQIVNVSSTYASDKYVSIPKDGSVSFIRFAYRVLNTDTLMVIRLDDSDPLPVDATNYTYSVFGGYTLPQLAADTQAALDTAVEQLQAQIGAAVSVGAQWYGKMCYCYGTSITSVHEGTGKYPPYLASLSGMNVVEKGRGGGGIGNAAGNWSSYSRGQVYASVCNITDGKTTADLIVLETGANDVADDVPLGTIFDTGTETLAGCLNDCIRYLQTNTNAQIAVMPSPSSKTSPQVKPKYYEWADMIRQICDVNRVSYLSPNANLGQAKLTSDNGSLYVVDSIHQTELGGYILAEQMWYQIRNIPCFYTELPANSNE